MTASALPPDPFRSRRLLAGLSFTGALLIAVALTISGGGCSKPPVRTSDDQNNAGPKSDPWKTAGTRLKKDTELTSVKTALTGLTNEVSIQEGQKLPTLSDEAFAALAAVVPLSPGDHREIRGAAFSGYDPVYLADCLYLRDSARALALTGLPPERQAELAFEWVCRQVYLYPWLRQLGEHTFRSTALPPTVVLRRGFGSGLERMYVFVALLQQLGLDGCLIGGPTVGPTTAEFNVNIRVPVPAPPASMAAVASVAPRGPFWAVGVRVGTDVRLFDPWRAQPLPLTLNQLRANPEAAKAWFEDPANKSGPTLDDAKKATVYLAVPVNALSPRMGAFEAHLGGELGVKVALDVKALEAKRAAFPDPKPTYWNSVDDPFAYGRVGRSFLPVDMGGSDPSPLSPVRLYESAFRDQIPAGAFVQPDRLKAIPAQQRLGATAAHYLAVSFVEPPNPRERVQRGQFQDAARDVVVKQEAFAAGMERLLNKDADQQVQDWIKAANEMYDALGVARLNGDKSEEGALAAQVENLWKQPGAQLLIDRASAEVGRAEASYLLALCKHEQAERLQVRLERATGPDAAAAKADALDAWKTAQAAWRTYEQLAATHAGFPGRAAHGSTLAARATKFVEADAKK
jgi:hypothetical protein